MLRVEGVCKTFGGDSACRKPALDNINLSLGRGEFVTVIGGNGAGKSTLANCITGFYQVDRGRILLDSTDITHYPEYKRSRLIGRVFQDPLTGTAGRMTVAENLAIAYAKGKPRGLRPGIRKRDLEFFRERLAVLGLGLEDKLAEKVGLLSGGQRQALTLLIAVIAKPKLLILDEHTAALDPNTAKKVLGITREIAASSETCTLMITHNMKAALKLGTRTIMMHEGRIVLDIQGTERGAMTAEKLIKEFERQRDRQGDRQGDGSHVFSKHRQGDGSLVYCK